MRLKNYAFYYNYNEIFMYNNVSTLHLLSKIHNVEYNMFVDRFNILTKDCEYNLLSRCDDIDEIKNHKLLTFEECVNKRCDEIISLAGDKDIYVAYSGGVDSTCVVCAFLMNDKLNKNKFFVICNEYAIQEYPYFYRKMKMDRVNIINIGSNIEELINLTKNDVIIVNGNCGDQIDGSSVITKRFYSIDYFLSWKDTVYRAATLRYLQATEKHISDIENYISLFDIDFHHTGDLSWFLGYAIKYNYAATYFKQLSYNPQNVVVFFDTVYFNKYGLVSYQMMRNRKSQESSYLYKTDWKKLIIEYTNDYDYFLYKGKEAPWIGTDFMANPGLSWTDDTGYHRIKNPSKFDIYNSLIQYIKPEYQDYYAVVEREEIL